MINQELLKSLISEGHTRFWCDQEEQRIPFLEALEEMGFEWNSGDKLTEINGTDYTVCDGRGMAYSLSVSRLSVLKSNERSERDICVSDLFDGWCDIGEEDLLGLLGA